jgi:hypothetical protein
MAYCSSELQKTIVEMNTYITWNILKYNMTYRTIYREIKKNEVISTMSRLIDKWNIKITEKLVTILCLMHDFGMTS